MGTREQARRLGKLGEEEKVLPLVPLMVLPLLRYLVSALAWRWALKKEGMKELW